MIDCNLTTNYLKYKGEICNKHSTTCVGCPLFQGKDNISDTCYAMSYRDPEKAIEILQKWVDENIHDDGGKNDPVNNPTHYTQGGIECIDAIEASMTEEEFQGFIKGQVIKYIWRYRLKDNSLQDLEKAKFYLDRLISEVGNENKVQTAE